ncbi:MAG TPA: hypothetical protein PKW90_01855 [Myxococcota bacterium]|nr:hypothetical protein [Myxococcota bacterium]
MTAERQALLRWIALLLRGALGLWLLINATRFARALSPETGEVSVGGGSTLFWPLLPVLAWIGFFWALTPLVEFLEARGRFSGLWTWLKADWKLGRAGGALDTILFFGLCILGYTFQKEWRALANPEGEVVGMDATSYLSNAIAVREGLWATYNTDKRILHALLANIWAGDGDIVAATQDISLFSIALLPALTYLLGRSLLPRFPALLAALLLASNPTPWAYTLQTTNYALFFATTTLSLATLGWALARPTWLPCLAAGLAGSLCFCTQEKAVVMLAPVLLTGCVAMIPDLWRATGAERGRRVGALLLGLGAAVLLTTLLAPPRDYTPFGSLIVNQREELNREMPYTWPSVKNADAFTPTPISPYLPGSWRNTDLEATLAGLLTPPDTNALRLVDIVAGNSARYTVELNTTIPPLSYRLQFNLRLLRQELTLLWDTGACLTLLAPVALLFGSRHRRPLLIFLALLSAWGPLSLKYNLRYFVHLYPLLAVFWVGGIWRLGGLSGRQNLFLLPPQLFLWGAMALCFWNGRSTAWLSPALPFPPPAAKGIDDPGGNALATKKTAAWLAAQPDEVTILDCSPAQVWLYLSRDGRVPDFDGGARCRAALAGDPPEKTWMVVSGHMEYRAPWHPDPRALLHTGKWRLLSGWDPRFGELPADSPIWTTSAVLVLGSTGR